MNRQQRRVFKATAVTKKYGYDRCMELAVPGTYQGFVDQMQQFAQSTGGTLVYEQDSSITVVSPDGARATAYYR